MDNLKLVDYTDSSSEDENLDLKPDIEDIEFGVNVETKSKKLLLFHHYNRFQQINKEE